MSEHIPAPGMWGEKDPNVVRRDLVREMNRLGVYRLEGTYAGGHDEGGLDDLSIFDKAGDSIPNTLTYDSALWQAVEDLLSTKFYSWALDCSVYGKVHVDLREKRAWTVGEEETTSYVEDTDPIDMRW